jgi:hypothetical protein
MTSPVTQGGAALAEGAAIILSAEMVTAAMAVGPNPLPSCIHAT